MNILPEKDFSEIKRTIVELIPIWMAYFSGGLVFSPAALRHPWLFVPGVLLFVASVVS
jgi:hypothetical protein